MASKSSAPAISSEDRVRDVAYLLWLEEGMPQGRSDAHWFKALELVNAEAAPVEASAPAKRKAPAAAVRKAAPAKTAPVKTAKSKRS